MQSSATMYFFGLRLNPRLEPELLNYEDPSLNPNPQCAFDILQTGQNTSVPGHSRGLGLFAQLCSVLSFLPIVDCGHDVNGPCFMSSWTHTPTCRRL